MVSEGSGNFSPYSELLKLAEMLALKLRSTGSRIAVAESVTGGMITQALVSIEGANAFFECGIVAYSMRMKEKLLGVEHDIVTNGYADSTLLSLAMCRGIRGIGESKVALATTGYATPAPPGRKGKVCITCECGALTETSRFTFAGDRQAIRISASAEALRMCIRLLQAGDQKSSSLS